MTEDGRVGSVVVRAACKSFGRHAALVGVDLDVADGAIAAVLGPSGSGKTTLLGILAGFERPNSGSIMIGGSVVDDDHRHVPAERRHIGYVPQEGSLFPHLDVRRNVGFGLSRLPRRVRRARVDELLAMVGLEELGARYPHQLSGGQQQRVALARALAPGPQLVLLDEPFVSLDASLRAQVRGDVLHILRRTGATALLVTHDQDEALSSADVVAVLLAGVVAQVATPAELYLHPAGAEVASFVGEANLLPGRARRGVAETMLGALTLSRPAPEGAALRVLVRPEQLAVRLGEDVARDRLASGLAAEVARVEYHGHDTTVWLRIVGRPAGFPTMLVARLAGRHGVREASTVHLVVEGTVEAWVDAPTGATPLPTPHPSSPSMPCAHAASAPRGRRAAPSGEREEEHGAP